MDLSLLPRLNAGINTAVAALLVVALLAIRTGRRRLHRNAMLAAVGASLIFLVSYLVYHANHGATRFRGTGTVRAIYLAILFSHTVLAAVALPLVLTAVVRALRGNFPGHRRIARVAWPIWFYVAVTGPVIYAFLHLGN